MDAGCVRFGSLNDDLESLNERLFFNANEFDIKTQNNEFIHLYLFRLLTTSEDSNLLCKLTFDDNQSLGGYDGQPWNTLHDLNTFASSKLMKKAMSAFPTLTITEPLYPKIPRPCRMHTYYNVNEKMLSENLLAKYQYLESACDRFTVYF